MFDSEFCSVRYIGSDHVVLLSWKKFCKLDDYREPVVHALELAGKHSGTNLVVDARRGFQDDPKDVEWGMKEFIPKLANETDCTMVVFILDDANNIDDEINLWGAELEKYFTVARVKTYDEAIEELALRD